MKHAEHTLVLLLSGPVQDNLEFALGYTFPVVTIAARRSIGFAECAGREMALSRCVYHNEQLWTLKVTARDATLPIGSWKFEFSDGDRADEVFQAWRIDRNELVGGMLAIKYQVPKNQISHRGKRTDRVHRTWAEFQLPRRGERWVEALCCTPLWRTRPDPLFPHTETKERGITEF